MTNGPGARVAPPAMAWPAEPSAGACVVPAGSPAVALTRTALAGWGIARHSWLAELIVSELVTNAIVHGDGLVSVRLCSESGSLRVEVHDDHPGRPVRRCPSAADEAGRGHPGLLVAGLRGMK